MQMTGRSMTSSEDGRYKFTGKERDASDGLDYFGKRYYDSWKAGWDQVDPMSDEHPEASPYNYVMNNPLKNIDLEGDSAAVSNNNDASNAAKMAIVVGAAADILDLFDPEPLSHLLLGLAASATVSSLTSENIGPGFVKAENNDQSEDKKAVDETIKDASKGKVSSSKQYNKEGGFDQANKDFDKLAGSKSKIQNRGNGTRTATTPEGTKLTVRPTSTEGKPTLDIDIAGQRIIKIRYK
jgi:RHS repeat-associated protein